MMRESAPDTAGPRLTESEDVIGSSPDALDRLLTRMRSALPRSLGRAAVATVAVVAVLVGLVVGVLTAPAGLSAIPAPAASTAPGVPDSAPDLLAVQDLAAIGEPATGGTYTRGSASAVPDPCSPPAPGDTGVSYVPGPDGATAVSFQVAGGTVTERVSIFADAEAARTRLRDMVANARSCQYGVGTGVSLGEISPGLGDQYVLGTVVRLYPSGGSSTVTLLLIRVGSVLVEFSLTGSTAAATEFVVRCRAIALAGLAR